MMLQFKYTGECVYGDINFQYSVYNSSQHGKIKIHIFPDYSIGVEAPNGLEEKEISAHVQKKSGWIYKHIVTLQKNKITILPREYVSGETHFYLGRRYMLKVLEVEQKKEEKVRLSGSYLKVYIQKCRKSKENIRYLLKKWYTEHALKIFSQRVQVFLQQDRLVWFKQMPHIKVIAMKKQWGSCSGNKYSRAGTSNQEAERTLVFNVHLIKAPLSCIDYVLLHEICHLKEHNHSKAFYALLNQYLPNYKELSNKLENMAKAYLNE